MSPNIWTVMLKRFSPMCLQTVGLLTLNKFRPSYLLYCTVTLNHFSPIYLLTTSFHVACWYHKALYFDSLLATTPIHTAGTNVEVCRPDHTFYCCLLPVSSSSFDGPADVLIPCKPRDHAGKLCT